LQSVIIPASLDQAIGRVEDVGHYTGIEQIAIIKTNIKEIGWVSLSQPIQLL
jgi:hypothetical protein